MGNRAAIMDELTICSVTWRYSRGNLQLRHSPPHAELLWTTCSHGDNSAVQIQACQSSNCFLGCTYHKCATGQLIQFGHTDTGKRTEIQKMLCETSRGEFSRRYSDQRNPQCPKKSVLVLHATWPIKINLHILNKLEVVCGMGQLRAPSLPQICSNFTSVLISAMSIESVK